MKKNINLSSLLTLFCLFFFSNLLSQNIRIAEIQDRDGYTNIREQADVKVNDYKTDLLKDSILDLKVKLKEETPPFFIQDFSYTKLNRREIQPFYTLFSDKDTNIKIAKKKQI